MAQKFKVFKAIEGRKTYLAFTNIALKEDAIRKIAVQHFKCRADKIAVESGFYIGDDLYLESTPGIEPKFTKIKHICWVAYRK